MCFIHLWGMPIYRFRFTLEENEDVVRDIDIKPAQSFESLGLTLQQSLKLPGTAGGVFYRSDDYFRKGEAIEMLHKDGTKKMRAASIMDEVEAPHQKFLYHLDPEHLNHVFCVELFKIIKEENPKTIYPFLVKSIGNLPKPLLKNIAPPPVDEDDLRSSDRFFELHQESTIDEEEIVGDMNISATPDLDVKEDDEDGLGIGIPVASDDDDGAEEGDHAEAEGEYGEDAFGESEREEDY